MSEIAHRTIETNGIRMHIAEKGAARSSCCVMDFRNPGIPGGISSKRWRKPGFRPWRRICAAMAGPTRRQEIEKYTLLHLVGDMVGVLDALGAEQAVIAGHDWGAPVAWHAAQLRPDRFRAVIGLSVPFRPRRLIAADQRDAANRRRNVLSALLSDRAVAEAELERDAHLTVRAMLFGASGDGRAARRASRSAWCRAKAASSAAAPAAAAVMADARPTWIFMSPSSRAPAFVAVSTGIATSTAAGSCWRRSRD